MSCYNLKNISHLTVIHQIQNKILPASWSPMLCQWAFFLKIQSAPWPLTSITNWRLNCFLYRLLCTGIKNFMELVIVYMCKNGSSFLRVGSRWGWFGQFCVTDVPAGVSSQHNKPSHMRLQKVPWKEKGGNCKAYSVLQQTPIFLTSVFYVT